MYGGSFLWRVCRKTTSELCVEGCISSEALPGCSVIGSKRKNKVEPCITAPLGGNLSSEGAFLREYRDNE